MFQPLPNPLSPLFLCALRSALPFPPRDPLCPPLSFSCPSLLKIAGDFSSLSPLQKKDFRTQNTKKNPYFRESNRIEIFIFLSVLGLLSSFPLFISCFPSPHLTQSQRFSASWPNNNDLSQIVAMTRADETRKT